MSISLSGLSQPLPNGPSKPPVAAFLPATQPPSGFSQLLSAVLGEVNAHSQAAQAATELSLAGGEITQVETLTAVKKADLALRMLIQVRNRVLEAYQEIKQMQM